MVELCPKYTAFAFVGLGALSLLTALSACTSESSLEEPNLGADGTAGFPPAAAGTAGTPGAGGSAPWVPPTSGGAPVVSTTGGAPAAGGTTAAGGAPAGGGGSVAVGGGGSGAGGAPVDCTIPATPLLDVTTLKECPMCTGKASHCVDETLVKAVAPDQVAQLAPCETGFLCVPDVLTQTLGKYDPPDCDSISGGAGRCLSECIGAIAALGSFLPQGTCAAGEKCAPCVDPRTGKDTGACSLACDKGPTEPKVVFSRCCSDQSGICVPPELVPENQRSALTQSTCGANTLCAPEKLADSTYKPATCDSIAGAEGRCLSSCVGLIDKQKAFLKQGTCAAGELCAPCTDPRTGEETGACTINGDAPTKPPIIFDAKCCADTGLCVPKSAVPEPYTSLVPVDTCASEGTDWVCAPTIKLNDLSAKFQKCQAMLFGNPVPPGDPNQFGGCIPKCIADDQIAKNPLTGAGIAQSDCPAGWMCAPCINPLDQKRTGACD